MRSLGPWTGHPRTRQFRRAHPARAPADRICGGVRLSLCSRQRVGCRTVSGTAAQLVGPKFVAEADVRSAIGSRADDPGDRHFGGADTLRSRRRALSNARQQPRRYSGPPSNRPSARRAGRRRRCRPRGPRRWRWSRSRRAAPARRGASLRLGAIERPAVAISAGNVRQAPVVMAMPTLTVASRPGSVSARRQHAIARRSAAPPPSRRWG